jgi:hypothetical protein
MPGNIQGLTTVGPHTSKRADRWLNFRFADPPLRNIRDREDSPGCRNPYNLWHDGDCIGDETTGMSVAKEKVLDDDLKFGGTKAYSYNIRGQCLDCVGSPVAGATVELWKVAPLWPGQDQPRYVATTVSDEGGLYGFAVPNTTDLYYVLAYVTGKGGVTVRTLTGAA